MILRLLFFTSIFFSSQVSFATGQCWRSELNPYTNAKFADENTYAYLLQSWLEDEPELPWITQLYTGWRTAKAASQESKRFKSDKRMHCYVGCRIAQETNSDVAQYAGWTKEYKDLTDCDINTRFEYDDQDATVLGGAIGDGTQGKNICLNSCPEN
jgi:hypothetical protein